MAPTAQAASAMPSKTRSAKLLRSTRSLKVPGSPSSALQTITFCAPGALRALAHFTAVAKPAPPRPRRLEACISASQPSRPRAMAAVRAAPGGMSRSSRASRRRMLSSMRKYSAGHRSRGRCWRISSAISLMRRWLSWPMARPLTSIAGPWSHRPVQDVVVTLTSPSSDSLPGSIHSLRHRASSNSALPSMRSVMLSENSTR